MATSLRTLVVGFGNPFMGDDGIGHAVIVELQKHPQPPTMRLEACNGDGLQLLGLWQGEMRVCIVDAVIRNQTPGTIHSLGHDEFMSVNQTHASAHQLSLVESLRMINIGYPEMSDVRYRLWGIEPHSVGSHQTLSPRVAAAVPEVARRLLNQLRSD